MYTPRIQNNNGVQRWIHFLKLSVVKRFSSYDIKYKKPIRDSSHNLVGGLEAFTFL